LLPYQGFGSGIQRALDAWPEIDFTDDRDGFLFTATVHRKFKIFHKRVVMSDISQVFDADNISTF